MSKVKIILNREGVGQLLQSEEVKNYIGGIASEKAADLGEGYGSDTYMAGTRAVASIFTETQEAARDNLKNNTLLRAVSG